MRQRTITAFFFAAVMLIGIFGYGAGSIYGLFLVITVGCVWELMGLLLAQEEKFRFARRIMGCLLAILPVFFAATRLFWPGNCGFSTPEEILLSYKDDLFSVAVELMLSLALIFPVLLASELFLESKSPFQNIGYYLTGVFYIGVPVALLFSIVTMNASFSPHRILGLLILVWTNDTGAYLTGKKFGKHKLFERISPKKTWEGTLGGGLLTVLMAWGISFLIKDFTLSQWLALSLVAAIGSNIGDLVESMLKRSVGVKDTGTFMPGHGGFLDRFDAFIFCLPFFWLVLQFV